MDPACLRVYEVRQRIDIRALQLLEYPPIQDEPRQLMSKGQLFEHVDGCRGCLRLDVALEGGQAQFLEQDARQLLRRVDIEGLSRERKNLRAPGVQLAFDPERLRQEC